PFFEPDGTLRRIATIVVLLFIVMGSLMALFVDPSAVEKTTLENVPERLRPVILDPTKPAVFVRAARTEMGGNEGEGAKSQGPEGKRGTPDAPKKEGITNIPKQASTVKKGLQKGPGVGRGSGPGKTKQAASSSRTTGRTRPPVADKDVAT